MYSNMGLKEDGRAGKRNDLKNYVVTC